MKSKKTQTCNAMVLAAMLLASMPLTYGSYTFENPESYDVRFISNGTKETHTASGTSTDSVVGNAMDCSAFGSCSVSDETWFNETSWGFISWDSESSHHYSGSGGYGGGGGGIWT